MDNKNTDNIFIYEKEDLTFFALSANDEDKATNDLQSDKQYFFVGIYDDNKSKVQDVLTDKVYNVKNINGKFLAYMGSKQYKQIDVIAEKNIYNDLDCFACKVKFLDADNTIASKYLIDGLVYDIHPLDSKIEGVCGFEQIYNFLLEESPIANNKKIESVVEELNKTMNRIVKFEVKKSKDEDMKNSL